MRYITHLPWKDTIDNNIPLYNVKDLYNNIVKIKKYKPNGILNIFCNSFIIICRLYNNRQNFVK